VGYSGKKNTRIKAGRLMEGTGANGEKEMQSRNEGLKQGSEDKDKRRHKTAGKKGNWKST